MLDFRLKWEVNEERPRPRSQLWVLQGVTTTFYLFNDQRLKPGVVIGGFVGDARARETAQMRTNHGEMVPTTCQFSTPNTFKEFKSLLFGRRARRRRAGKCEWRRAAPPHPSSSARPVAPLRGGVMGSSRCTPTVFKGVARRPFTRHAFKNRSVVSTLQTALSPKSPPLFLPLQEADGRFRR